MQLNSLVGGSSIESLYIYIYIYIAKLGSDRQYLDSDMIISKFCNRISKLMIQAIECDLISKSYLHTKNHMISNPHVSTSQKLNSPNKIKLDIFFLSFDA